MKGCVRMFDVVKCSVVITYLVKCIAVKSVICDVVKSVCVCICVTPRPITRNEAVDKSGKGNLASFLYLPRFSTSAQDVHSTLPQRSNAAAASLVVAADVQSSLNAPILHVSFCTNYTVKEAA